MNNVTSSGSYFVKSSISLMQPQKLGNGRQSVEPVSGNNRTKSYLIQKVQALIPYLNEILKQNDSRTVGIVDKLSGLKDNLDGIFSDIEKEISLSDNENEDLRNRLN
jgi:hypothetical protein